MNKRIQDSGFSILRRSRLALPFMGTLVLLLAAYCVLPTADFVKAAPAANVRPVGVVTDTPAIAITNASATTSATPTTSAHETQVQWTFGTVSGTYSSCTVQAKTSYDGTNYLTLGSPVTVTATTGAVNAWTLIEQLGTSSVTTSTASSTAALGFGQATAFNFSCSSYGTAAAVNISVIYR
ncbi:MAG TPA: hypothetical protein VE957_22800 [Terriglobales bacterium]|nr:hypothetical protein [Terriglobales bacterium]